MSKLVVRVDERVRLVAAALAGSDWPAREQKKHGAHAVHPQAKATRHFLLARAEHPAVTAANRYLSQGASPAELFAVAVRSTWPDFRPLAPLPERLQGWPAQLAAFQAEAAPGPSFWASNKAPWEEAVADLQQIFTKAGLPPYLEQLLRRPLAARVVIVPNLIYPALETVAVAAEGAYTLIIPPPKAVGESPPWPYRDEGEGVLAAACYHLLSLTLVQTLATLSPAQETRFRHAATALFLEHAVDETAASFYLMRRKRAGVRGLPEAMTALRLFLNGSPEASSLDLLLTNLAS